MEKIREELFDFWFGNDPDDGVVAEAKAGLWWGHKPETDEALREQFGTAAAAAAVGVLDHWAGSPRGRLALILLLDQMPRVIHRGQPESFAVDADALKFAEQGLASGADRLLRPIERVFFYLPFEHSEVLEDQERSLELFRELARSVPELNRKTFDSYFEYAVRHHEIVERFGRFPHRNQILGRESTAEEKAYLAEPGSGF